MRPPSCPLSKYYLEKRKEKLDSWFRDVQDFYGEYHTDKYDYIATKLSESKFGFLKPLVAKLIKFLARSVCLM